MTDFDEIDIIEESLVVYHGTLESRLKSIKKNGLDTLKSIDYFGGLRCCMTYDRDEAKKYAMWLSRRLSDGEDRPVVIEFKVPKKSVSLPTTLSPPSRGLFLIGLAQTFLKPEYVQQVDVIES